ncbi:hypothetical protein NDU88_004978 [Pleurodeles waltl]|uniref:Uncharacterized protein n=1 Tax=Pleurodeles waltl TaxID=8319 RepID=A0AAV7SKG1_PLEWA|nr:hypothetical protein NDU88_004978 [Pleurodeles waltl]
MIVESNLAFKEGPTPSCVFRRHSVETVLGHPLATKWLRYATNSNISDVRENVAVPVKYHQGTTKTQSPGRSLLQPAAVTELSSGRKRCRGYFSKCAAAPVSGGRSTQTEPSDASQSTRPTPVRGSGSTRTLTEPSDGPPLAARMRVSQIATGVEPEAETSLSPTVSPQCKQIEINS